MNTVSDVLSPTLLAVFAAMCLGVGAILFVLLRRGGLTTDLGVPLSWSEPVEVRLMLYLILAAFCGACALVLRILQAFPAEGSLLAWALLVLVAIGFLLNLAFFYAAMGALLQAAVGTRGRPPYWFTRLLSPVDGAIMNVGDRLGGILFHPAPALERRRARTSYYDDDFAPDEEIVERRRARPASPWPTTVRRRRVVLEDEEPEELAFEDEPPFRRPVRPAARRPRQARHLSDELDETEEYVVDEEFPGRHAVRTRSAQPRDVARERIELAIREYEASLEPAQLEKLREMRRIVEALKQGA